MVDILHHLLMQETMMSHLTPFEWTEDYGYSLVEMLKSPAEATAPMETNEIETCPSRSERAVEAEFYPWSPAFQSAVSCGSRNSFSSIGLFTRRRI